jgi:hypothetical protein
LCQQPGWGAGTGIFDLALQLYSFTALQLYSFTALQLYSFTALQVEGCVTADAQRAALCG